MWMDDFDLNTVCFYWLPVSPSCHFRWRHPSSLPMRAIWEHFGGSCLRSRFCSTPCFFESMATHARGLGRSLRFTHAQTNFMHVWVFLWMRLFFNPMPGSCTLIGRERSREQLDDVPYANESRDPQIQYPYCLSRALIGYRPCRPYLLLRVNNRNMKKNIRT